MGFVRIKNFFFIYLKIKKKLKREKLLLFFLFYLNKGISFFLTQAKKFLNARNIDDENYEILFFRLSSIYSK